MAPGQSKTASVYDFLYVDTRRVAQFLSQFNEYGHLTSLTRVAGETSTGSGGINVAAAKVEKGSSTQTTQTRQFDAQWINPLTFMDEAGRRAMIVRGIDKATVGQLVLITGQFGVLDLSIVKPMWNDDEFIKNIADSDDTNDLRKPKFANAKKSGLSLQLRLIKMLMQTLPHAVQGAIFDESFSAWFSLREDFLQTPVNDILLKHGIRVSGTWNCIGILDARLESDGTEFVEGVEAIAKFGHIGDAFRQMLPSIKQMLGRPQGSYGITPILIFREVFGANEAPQGIPALS